MGGDGWDGDELLRGAGAELEGAIFTNHWAIDLPSARSRTFVAAYRQRYQHEPSSLTALGYDAAQLLADAIARASGDTPEAIRDALQATRGFVGVTGKMSFDAQRDPEKAAIVVRIQDSRFVYLASVE